MGLADRGRCGRFRKSAWVQPLLDRVSAGIETLPGHHIGKAAKVGGSRHRAINCKRLAALMRVKTVDHPSAQDRIYGLVGIRQERASATERQVVGAGNMNDVCCIAVAKGVVGLDPESGKTLGSILLVLRCLSVLIAHALAP